MARLHAVTGQARRRDCFEQILDIRNGLPHRPDCYFEIPCRDLAPTGGDPDGRYLQPSPISRLAQQADFTGEEPPPQRQSEVMTIDLAGPESEVMAALARRRAARRPDRPGRRARDRGPGNCKARHSRYTVGAKALSGGQQRRTSANEQHAQPDLVL